MYLFMFVLQTNQKGQERAASGSAGIYTFYLQIIIIIYIYIFILYLYNIYIAYIGQSTACGFHRESLYIPAKGKYKKNKGFRRSVVFI